MSARIHFTDTRLFVNAGIRFPACAARARKLDTDKARLECTTNPLRVTCKRCSRLALSAAQRVVFGVSP